jgi:hypothetical protein
MVKTRSATKPNTAKAFAKSAFKQLAPPATVGGYDFPFWKGRKLKIHK